MREGERERQLTTTDTSTIPVVQYLTSRKRIHIHIKFCGKFFSDCHIQVQSDHRNGLPNTSLSTIYLQSGTCLQ